MRSTTSGQNCVTSTDLLSGSAAAVGLICTADYSPYLDSTCTDTQTVILSQQNFPFCTSKKNIN